VKTVVLDGKSYTKASEVAAQFGYTADYIGQLCRGKKIDARLVGRTWFVHVPSVEAHRDQRYAYQKAQAQTTEPKAIYNTLPDRSNSTQSVDMTSKKYVKRVVPAPLSHRPFRPDTAPSETFFNPRPKYEPDEYVLNPKITRDARITLLKVGMADSERVTVASSKRTETTLRPEPLPEVVLKGSLVVQGLRNDDGDGDDSDGADEVTATEPADEAKISRDNQENNAKVVIHPESRQTGRGLKVAINTPQDPMPRTSSSHSAVVSARPAPDSFVYHVDIRQVDPSTDVPVASSDESIVKEVPIHSPWQVASLYALGFAFALMTASTVLMAESVAVAMGTETTRGVTLQPASLMEIFEQIFP
jgi:hypothetical protein